MKELDLNEEGKFGQSLYDIDLDADVYRRYLLYNWSIEGDAKSYMPAMTEYYVLPEGNQETDYIPTGKEYTARGVIEKEPYKYEIGKTIYFNNSDSASYFISGINQFMDVIKGETSTVRFLRSDGTKSKACFRMGQLNSDLTCHIELYPWLPSKTQSVIIRSDGRVLYDGVITADMPYINFSVPKDCVRNDLLVLDFEYPDACTVGGDTRLLSLAFVSARFMAIEAETEQIRFAKLAGNGTEYVYSGWHGQEDDLCWTDEEAELQVVLPAAEDRQIRIQYWTHSGAGETSVYYNDHFIGTLPHHNSSAEEVLLLPAEYSAGTNMQMLRFVTDGATIPVEYYKTHEGESTDTRRLGIAVNEIRFKDPYVLGKEIQIDNNDVLDYFPSGTTGYVEELDLLWSEGTRGKAVFPLGETQEDLVCHIDLFEWMPRGEQRVMVRSNGKTLYDGTVTQEEPYLDFPIPNSCVRDKQLIMDFYYPDAASPKSLGVSEDERVIAIAFQKILIQEQSKLNVTERGAEPESALQG